jgi:general secretion pathway protein J
MLVALALAALITSFLSGGIVFGRRAWEQSAERDEALAAEAVRGALKEALERIVPYRPDANLPTLMVEGWSDRLSFVALGDPQVETGGLRVVRLEVVRTDGGSGHLVFAALPVRKTAAAGNAQSGMRNVLINGVTRLTFRYFGVRENSENLQWLEEWRGRVSLPRAIHVAIHFQDRRKPTIDLIAVTARASTE